MASDLVQGSDCLFQIRLSDDYAPVVCAKSFSFNPTVEMIETTTKGTGQNKSFDYHTGSYTLSLTGIVKVIDADAKPHSFDLLQLQKQFIEVPYRLIYEDGNNFPKIIEGVALISSMQLSAAAGSFAEFNAEFQGTGDYEIRDTIEGCETSIPDTFFNVQLNASGGSLEVNINSISGIWARIEYRIDGGSQLVGSFAPGGEENGGGTTFFINSIPAGEHSITLIPQCVNGADGEPLTKSFTMT